MTEDEFIAIRQALENQHGASVKPIILRVESPTIYIFDEVHNLTDLIDDNIRIAKTLVQIGEVSLLGVEGCEGDKIAMRDLMHLSDDGRCFAERPRMISAMLNEKQVEIVGVDSKELSNQIKNECRAMQLEASAHPKQETRSAHMIRTLVEKLHSRSGARAAILNAGVRHNDDIERILRATRAQEISAESASFIRIRSRFYPTT